jgi:hypothetical protein
MRKSIRLEAFMDEINVCPECGAAYRDGKTCADHFHQMLAWEYANEHGVWAVHHLTVLCYYLQHPSQQSSDGLRHSRVLLREFVEEGVSPADVRERSRDTLDSGSRQWKFTGAPGSYDRSVKWTMTIDRVAEGDLGGYCDRVRAWAVSVNEALKDVAVSG